MASELKIWDAGEHYEGYWDAFANSFADRDSWQQVLYGTTDYDFIGDAVIENRYFYISFNSNSQDDLHVKKEDHTLWRNILYRCYYTGTIEVGGSKEYAGSTDYVRILLNTEEEAVIEHHGARSPIVTTYHIFADKPWVEVRPVERAHMLGIHGKVRMALAPVEGGNDYVIDSLRDIPDLYVPPEGKLVICFFESPDNPFMWVVTFPSFESANTYFNCDSGPDGDTMWSNPGNWGGLDIPRSWPGCITATYLRFGNQEEPVVVGALAHWDNWYREQVDTPVHTGDTYSSSWVPTYPGRWRMTMRIAERQYDQGFEYDGVTEFPAQYFTKDVYDGDFTMTSPIDGHLDYVIMYMYDRTEETPDDIFAPMDVYRYTAHKGAISGTVTDASTGVPIETALLSIGALSDTTNSNGNYTIEDVSIGDHTVTCTKAGYRPSDLMVTVAEGETTRADFQLTKEDVPYDDYYDAVEDDSIDVGQSDNDGTAQEIGGGCNCRTVPGSGGRVHFLLLLLFLAGLTAVRARKVGFGTLRHQRPRLRNKKLTRRPETLFS